MTRRNARTPARPRVAIIGGGPGGLFTTLMLNRFRPDLAVTLFEADARVGGKVVTGRMPRTGALHDAGAAELYDYSASGEDPLRDLVAELGLETLPVEGGAFFFEGRMLGHGPQAWQALGDAACREVAAYDARCRALFSPESYYQEDFRSPAAIASAAQTYADLLAGVADPVARRFIATLAHSDVAMEPDRTSAMYGVHNWLMNFPEYMRLYAVRGGLEGLVAGVARRIDAEVLTGQRIAAVGREADGRYRLRLHAPEGGTDGVRGGFDAVVAALPINHLHRLGADDPALERALLRHRAHYDHPAHYLRATLAFPEASWRRRVDGDFFMLDAFGGCCVYDLAEKVFGGGLPTLGWLLSGDAAMTLADLPDAAIVAAVLDSLPDALRDGLPSPVDAAVHRWTGAVNGWPMGSPIEPVEARHRPDAATHPGFFVVGDYLYDSTLNGVIESAEVVADFIDGLIDEAPRRGSREDT